MYRARISAALRHVVGAGIISGAAVLAACSDSATAPQAPVVPPNANALTVGTDGPRTLSAYVTARVADTLGNTIKEPSRVDIITLNPNVTMHVLDNDVDDLDPTPGYIKVKVTKSQTYQVCFIESMSYTGDFWGNTFSPCAPPVTSSLQTVNVGVGTGKRKPQVVMLAKNEFGALVGGATYTIKAAEWINPVTAWDGSGFDRSPVVGNFTFDYFPKQISSAMVCEVSPPPKHLLTSTKCFTFPLKFGGITTLTFNHEQVLY